MTATRHLRLRRAPRWLSFIVTFVIAAPLPASAQSAMTDPIEIARDVALRDMKILADKFIALAEAIPESAYEYRPSSGVRSVREVLMLIASENYGVVVPVAYLPPPPAFGDSTTLKRFRAISTKADVVDAVRASADHARRSLEAFPRDRTVVPFFNGADRPIQHMLAALSADQHEHLGQLIAYARANGVVPPWSRR